MRTHTALPTATGLVVVDIGGHRYALLLDDVVEVQRMVALAALPGAPAVVEGVVDLRGRIVPVLDIRTRFGLPEREATPDDQLVVARAGVRTVAIRVDATLGVRHVAATDIETGATDVPGVRHVAGVTRDEGGIVLIHDLATFLSWDEGQQLDDAMHDEQDLA